MSCGLCILIINSNFYLGKHPMSFFLSGYFDFNIVVYMFCNLVLWKDFMLVSASQAYLVIWWVYTC